MTIATISALSTVSFDQGGRQLLSGPTVHGRDWQRPALGRVLPEVKRRVSAETSAGRHRAM